MGFQLDISRAALVITDPQVEFLSPRGVSWQLLGASVVRHHTVENIERLLRAARQANMLVAISPHLCGVGGPLDRLMGRFGPAGGPGRLTREAWGAGSDVMPQFKPYLLQGRTIMAAPHRMYGPGDGHLAGELRRRGIAQVILAGMSANLCLESHLRALLEQGFEVAAVEDATAAARLPEGDGYLAAMTNFRCLASAVWSTDEVVRYM
jgi:nicotinamidase-related amidase